MGVGGVEFCRKFSKIRRFLFDIKIKKMVSYEPVLQKRRRMKNTYHILFILMLLVSGIAGTFLMCYLTPTSGGDGNDVGDVTGIASVVMAENDYYVNQPIVIENSKICLSLYDGSKKWIDLQDSNVKNFTTASVGEYKFVVEYDGFSFEVPYTVSYKKIECDKLASGFYLNEEIDLNGYKLNMYDFYDCVVAQKSFSDCEVENLRTNEVGSFFAKVEYGDFKTEFNYKVNYKKLELIFADGRTNLNFNVGETMNGLAIICYDNFDLATTILNLTNQNVIVRGFDTSSVSYGQRKATIYVYGGATLDFEYSVV